MKSLESKVGVKGFLATISSEVLLMRLFTRHSHYIKFQNSSDTDLLGKGVNGSNSSLHKLNKKFWRRSDGRLPLDSSFDNNQHSRNVGVFDFQSPSLVLNDLGEDIVLDIYYPSMSISNPKTNGIYDEDPQWKRKQPNQRVLGAQSTPNPTTSLTFQPKVATSVTPLTVQPSMSIDTHSNIKVRDFAFEAHGAKCARVVSEVDVLKHQYTKERAAHHTPPVNLIDDLSYFDPDWLSDAQNKSDEYFIDILAKSL